MAKQGKKDTRKVRQKIAQAPTRTLRSILTGGVISSDFFYRHLVKFFLAVVLILFYISTKYQCQTGMETIKKLENRLEVVKTESIREKAKYMSSIRESSMTALADSIRPGLAVQPQPPFVIHDEEI